MQLVFKLALCIGEGKPLKLLQQLTSSDIALWQAFDRLHPIGKQYTDFLIAQLTALMFNMWKGKEEPPLTVDEVLGKQQQLTEEYVRSVIRQAKHHGTN